MISHSPPFVNILCLRQLLCNSAKQEGCNSKVNGMEIIVLRQ